MKNSHKFFKNHDCKYFPCHREPDKDNFNCLFCYCPLHALGESCGGHFMYNTRGIKVCVDCHLPHTPEYYDIVVAKIMEANATLQRPAIFSPDLG